MSSVSPISSSIMRKSIPVFKLYPQILISPYPIHKFTKIAYPKLVQKCNISLGSTWLVSDPTEIPIPPRHGTPKKPDVPPEVPQTPNIPDFDPIPPEKPVDPPPMSPSPNPEFPGLPHPSLPKPEAPRPPHSPPGRDVPLERWRQNIR